MKSEFSKKRIRQKRDILDLFKIAHANVVEEQKLLWQSSQFFLFSNSFLAGFIASNLSDTSKNKFGNILLSLIGLSVSILWLMSYTRILNYYKFRIAQAKQREPENWMLFNKDGEAFSKGESVMVGGERYSFGIGILSNLTIVRILVLLFIGFYLLTFFITILGIKI